MAAQKKVTSTVRANPARLTRAGVAKLLGVSVRTVQRLEGKELRPVLEHGVHYFDASDVAAYAASRRRPSQLTEGELAAELFARFERQEDIAKIVRDLRVPPSVVRQLFAEWKTELEDGYIAQQDRAAK